MKKFLLFSLFIVAAAFVNAQELITIGDPELIPIKLERISPAIRDISPAPLSEGERLIHKNPFLEQQLPSPNPEALPKGADPALQTSYEKGLDGLTAATILSNWEGLTANVDPSDNTLAVGPKYVMQMTNNNSSTYIRIWNKSGDILVNNTKVSSFTGINDYGDPNLIYDHAAKRFVFTVLYSFSQSKLVVCVSQTSDPTGAWYVYSFTTDGGFPDYPKIAVWGNSYFITTNSNLPTIFALKRNDMLDGIGTGVVQKFTLAGFPSLAFESPAPVTRIGANAPPSNEKAMIMRVADDAWGASVGPDHLEIFKIKINWNTPANSTITGPFILPIAPLNSNLCGYNSLNCVPQPGTTTKLDPLGSIIMDKVQYRNLGTYEAIVCTHTCNADGNGNAGVRWYELRKDGSGEWFVYQQGTYAPSTDGRFIPSISINDKGAIALGYNISSSSIYPGIRITGRDTCDALNTMSVPETVIKEGTSKNQSNRYGDYNAMVTDPKDGSFWMTANYNVTTDWTTSVVHFTLDPCELRVATANSEINNLLVKPNPASSEVTISFMSSSDKNVTIQIVDMTGQRILEQKRQAMLGLNETTLDVHHVENGYYFVKVLTSKGDVVQKLVIQR